MSKAVLISIRPKWCEKIINGQKTIEVRKTRPKMNPPFKCYIYKCGNGKVIGEFLCDEIININGAERIPSDAARPTCIEPAELHQYLGAATGFGWHISDLRVYDHPRDLWEFTAACRYKNDDGTCPSCRIACSFQRYDYNHDGSINIVECENTIRRPPQSWRYVEEEIWNDWSD
jgi:predicted transcriptional regulator